MLYYDNGDVSLSPDEDVDNYSDYNGKPKPMSFYSWKGTCDQIYRYGPFLLMVGPKAYNNYYDDYYQEMNTDYYETVLTDRPVDWEMASMDNTVEALKELHMKYNIKERNDGLKDVSVYYIYKDSDKKELYKLIYYKSKDFSLTYPSYDSYMYPLLYVRSDSFRY